MSTSKNKNLPGIFLMTLAMLLFQVMDAIAKWLVLDDIPAVQIVAIRSWIMLPMILIILVITGKLSQLRTRRPVLHGFRGLLTFFAPFLYFSALKDMPIADATVIFFSATFILTAASALVFKEQVGIHRWSAVVVGFAGVVIAMNPQGGGDISAYLLVMGSTTVYAISFILGKQLSAEDPVIMLVFAINLGMGVMASALLPWFWVSVSLEILGLMLAMTVIALFAHYAITSAFSMAEVSAITPFEYTALVWAAMLGYFLWAEVPSDHIWLGAAIIITSGLYVIHRESIRQRQ